MSVYVNSGISQNYNKFLLVFQNLKMSDVHVHNCQITKPPSVVTAVSDLASKLASQDNVTDEVKVAGSVAIIIPKESTDGSSSELYLSADGRQKKSDLANSKNVGDSNTYFKVS